MNTEISGKIVFKDYWRFALYQWRYSFLIFWVALSIIISLVFLVETTPLIANIFTIVFFPIPYLLIFFLIVLVKERREYKSLNSRFHERIINVSEEKIRYGIRENQRDIQWSDMKKGVFFKRMIILYTKSNQPLMIPRHFFSSSTQEKEWIDFIKKHISN